MKKREKLYQRLPGRAAGLYRRARLWLGRDHLLAVDSNTYQESYQRYYFKDIQAIIIRKSAKGKIFNALAGVPAALAGLQLLTLRGDSPWMWFWGLVAGFLLLLLLVNLFQGPTCVSHLRTPITTVALPSLHRLRTARKVRDRIRLCVEREQGRLDQEQIRQAVPAQQPALPTVGNLGRSAAGAKLRTDAAGGSSGYAGWAHWLLLACCLALAGLLLLYLDHNGAAMAGVGGLLTGLLLVVDIIALAKQTGSSAPAGVKGFAWSVMILLFIIMVAGYFGMLFALLRSGQVQPMFSQWALFLAMAQLKPLETPFLAALFIGAALALVAAALFGAFSLLSWRRRFVPVSTPAASAAVGRGR